MRKISITCSAILCAMLLLPSVAKADIDTIRDSNSAYYGTLGVGVFNYKEKTVPDSERGAMPAVALGISYMSPITNMWYSVEGNLTIGDADYYGSVLDLNTGISTPYEGTTHEMVVQADGKMGKGFAVSKAVMITPYLDLGFRYWSRDLELQVEKYRHLEALFGAMVQWSPSKRLVFTGYGAAGAQFLAQMEGLGHTFDLGPAAIYKAGGKIGYDISKRWELFTALDYQYFRYAASDPALYNYGGTTYLINEPSSFTSQATWRVGLAYHMR